jgi:hypothetical protein
LWIWKKCEYHWDNTVCVNVRRTINTLFNIVLTPIILPIKIYGSVEYYNSYDNNQKNNLPIKLPKKEAKVIDKNDDKSHVAIDFHKQELGKYACYYIHSNNVYELQNKDIYGTYIGKTQELCPEYVPPI